MRVMIVTHQYPPQVGGVPRVTHDLAVGLASRGMQVWLIAPNMQLKNAQAVEAGVQVCRLRACTSPLSAEKRVVLFPHQQLSLLIRSVHPDVIHVHSPLMVGQLARALGQRLGIPTIATHHFLPANVSQTLAKYPSFHQSYYAFLHRFYNQCSLVTAPTQTALNLLQIHGLRVSSLVISNGIDLRKYEPIAAEDQTRHRLGLPETGMLILHVGRLSPEKRIEVVLAAVARMQSQAHLVLVGRGPAERALRAQVQRLGLQACVSFLGQISDADVHALRLTANVYAIASEAELQSLSTMEAMACGLPIVAARALALPELIIPPTNGLLFQPGNAAELAHHLDLILQNADLRARMGLCSRAKIVAHDQQMVLNQWEEVYARVTSGQDL